MNLPVCRSYVAACPLDAGDAEAIEVAQHFFASCTLDWIVVLDDAHSLEEVHACMPLANVPQPDVWLQTRAMVPIGDHGRFLLTSSTELHGVEATRLEVFTTEESIQASGHVCARA